ncbi:MAG TPA: hypothetical protein VF980_04355 [Thermoanaerobaculia bacterium]
MSCIACALVAAAAGANQVWLDRHFLPSFWMPREEIVSREMIVRAAVAVTGLLLLLVSRRIGRVVARAPLYAFTIALAGVFAFGAAEVILRVSQLLETPPQLEPRTHIDARLGWLFDPSRTGTVTLLGHRTEYVFDRNGYRVASPGVETDFNAPTIVFTGESIMVGHHLAWADTIPAQTSKMLGVQGANIAVSGFGSDQSYLRLTTELPRFRHPVAVVSLFAPALFDRNLEEDRPHLAPGLEWRPRVKPWRLASLFGRAVAYRSDDEIERGVAMTRDVLAATIRLARSRGAVPLIVVPQFEPEEARERELRRRILDDAHIPYVYVPLDPDDRVENDGHPDADGARDIAEAVAGALRPELARAEPLGH